MTIATAPVRRGGLTLVQTGEDQRSLTFRELGELWLNSHRQIKANTRVGYESQLRLQIGRFIGERAIDELSVDDMAAFVVAMERTGYEPYTIRNAYMTATAVLDYGIRLGHLTANPARLLPGRERPKMTRYTARILTAGEIRVLLDHAMEPYRTIFAIAIFAGLRSGELSGLQFRDIDLVNGRLHVRRQAQNGLLVPPKTDNAARTVALLDPLPSILERYCADRRSSEPDSLLFVDKGKPLRAHRLLYTLRRTARQAGIEQHPDEPPIRVHDLRHAAASIMIAGRADVAFVARQLGHSSPAITLSIYAHLFDEAANLTRVRDYVSGEFANLGSDSSPAATAAQPPVTRHRPVPSAPVVPPAITPAIAAMIAGLTRREHTVLTLAAEGLPTKMIAQQLGIAPQTAKLHLGSVYKKLSVANRTQATRVAFERGLVDHTQPTA